MLWLALTSALAANAPAAEPAAAPHRQAQAVVRIVRAATVRLGPGASAADAEASVRETSIREIDGSRIRAVLVEFS